MLGELGNRDFEFVCCSNNNLGMESWPDLLSSLEKCSMLSSLNGCIEYEQMVSGQIEHLNLYRRPIGVAVHRYLRRSVSTLRTLNLRLALVLCETKVISFYIFETGIVD